MTRPPNYPYTGIFLSELAVVSRTSVAMKYDRCAHRRAFEVADLIAEHGNQVMADVLGIIIARCPNWHARGVSYPQCSAVYAEPLAEEERVRIGSPDWRSPHEPRDTTGGDDQKRPAPSLRSPLTAFPALLRIRSGGRDVKSPPTRPLRDPETVGVGQGPLR